MNKVNYEYSNSKYLFSFPVLNQVLVIQEVRGNSFHRKMISWMNGKRHLRENPENHFRVLSNQCNHRLFISQSLCHRRICNVFCFHPINIFQNNCIIHVSFHDKNLIQNGVYSSIKNKSLERGHLRTIHYFTFVTRTRSFQTFSIQMIKLAPRLSS